MHEGDRADVYWSFRGLEFSRRRLHDLTILVTTIAALRLFEAPRVAAAWNRILYTGRRQQSFRGVLLTRVHFWTELNLPALM